MNSLPRSSWKQSDVVFIAIFSFVALAALGILVGWSVGAFAFLLSWLYWFASRRLSRLQLRALVVVSWTIAIGDLLTAHRWGFVALVERLGLYYVLIGPLFVLRCCAILGMLPLKVLADFFGRYGTGGTIRSGDAFIVWACIAIVLSMATVVRRANCRSHERNDKVDESEKGGSAQSCP